MLKQQAQPSHNKNQYRIIKVLATSDYLAKNQEGTVFLVCPDTAKESSLINKSTYAFTQRYVLAAKETISINHFHLTVFEIPSQNIQWCHQLQDKKVKNCLSMLTIIKNSFKGLLRELLLRPLRDVNKYLCKKNLWYYDDQLYLIQMGRNKDISKSEKRFAISENYCRTSSVSIVGDEPYIMHKFGLILWDVVFKTPYHKDEDSSQQKTMKLVVKILKAMIDKKLSFEEIVICIDQQLQSISCVKQRRKIVFRHRTQSVTRVNSPSANKVDATTPTKRSSLTFQTAIRHTQNNNLLFKRRPLHSKQLKPSRKYQDQSPNRLQSLPVKYSTPLPFKTKAAGVIQFRKNSLPINLKNQISENHYSKKSREKIDRLKMMASQKLKSMMMMDSRQQVINRQGNSKQMDSGQKFMHKQFRSLEVDKRSIMLHSRIVNVRIQSPQKDDIHIQPNSQKPIPQKHPLKLAIQNIYKMNISSPQPKNIYSNLAIQPLFQKCKQPIVVDQAKDHHTHHKLDDKTNSTTAISHFRTSNKAKSVPKKIKQISNYNQDDEQIEQVNIFKQPPPQQQSAQQQQSHKQQLSPYNQLSNQIPQMPMIENQSISERQKSIEMVFQKESQPSPIHQKRISPKNINYVQPQEAFEQYITLINILGDVCIKCMKHKEQLKKYEWKQTVYYIYERFSYERTHIQQRLARKQKVCRFDKNVNTGEWHDFAATDEYWEMQRKIQKENSVIRKTLKKFGDKVIKEVTLSRKEEYCIRNIEKILQADKPSKRLELSKYAIKSTIEFYDSVTEMTDVSQTIKNHLLDMIFGLRIVGELDGLITPVSKLYVNLENYKNYKDLKFYEKMVDQLYELYFGEKDF